MSAVPVILNGVLMPKTKGSGDQPKPAIFLGYASYADREVGGGPMPGGPGDAHPEHPIVIPDPPTNPPSEPSPGLAVVIKPAPATGGWGLAAKDQTVQWFYVPGESGAGPKR